MVWQQQKVARAPAKPRRARCASARLHTSRFATVDINKKMAATLSEARADAARAVDPDELRALVRAAVASAPAPVHQRAQMHQRLPPWWKHVVVSWARYGLNRAQMDALARACVEVEGALERFLPAHVAAASRCDGQAMRRYTLPPRLAAHYARQPHYCRRRDGASLWLLRRLMAATTSPEAAPTRSQSLCLS